MSLRFVPPAHQPNTHNRLGGQAHSLGAPSAPGLHDTLRAGVGPQSAAVTTSKGLQTPDSAHPLEARLKQWEATQEAMRMETLRRTFGISEPIRRQMELKITRDGDWRPAMLGNRGPSVHDDILTGRDTSCTWEDVFTGEEMRNVPGFHDEMERKVRMH